MPIWIETQGIRRAVDDTPFSIETSLSVWQEMYSGIARALQLYEGNERGVLVKIGFAPFHLLVEERTWDR